MPMTAMFALEYFRLSKMSTMEQRAAAVQNLCVSQDFFCKRADYKHGECFLSALPLLGMDADIERKARRNALVYHGCL